MKPRKLLCLCDSPTLESGFARVAQNLISRWHEAKIFDEIWCWGIGYTGFPHQFTPLVNRIIPAATSLQPQWYHPENLKRFLELLQQPQMGTKPGGFTHVWLMQDLFALDRMAEAFKEIVRKQDIRSLLYFPVDAPLHPKWTRLITSVDVPVAYCLYGVGQARIALSARRESEEKSSQEIRQTNWKLDAIPHGVDTTIYKPLDLDECARLRQQTFQGAIAPDQFLMVNVAQHQPRKGLAQSLMVLKRVQEMRPELKAVLYCHCASTNPNEGTDLVEVASQLGLKVGRDMFFGDGMFHSNMPVLAQKHLNEVYNMADLLLTTSYGEGWGLPITEAMAVGTPVAGPRHTSIADLLGEGRGILFDTLGWDVISRDNSRLRPRSDVDDAARRIIAAEATGRLTACSEAGMLWVRDALNWDSIAKEWLALFKD